MEWLHCFIESIKFNVEQTDDRYQMRKSVVPAVIKQPCNIIKHTAGTFWREIEIQMSLAMLQYMLDFLSDIV